MLTGLLTMLSIAQADITISLDSLSADSLEVRTHSCTPKQGGLLASAMVVGALAAQKSSFDAYAPEGAAFRLGWSWQRETAVQEVLGGTPAQQACISEAMQIVSPTQGHCSAILLAGAPAAAASDVLQASAGAQP